MEVPNSSQGRFSSNPHGEAVLEVGCRIKACRTLECGLQSVLRGCHPVGTGTSPGTEVRHGISGWGPEAHRGGKVQCLQHEDEIGNCLYCLPLGSAPKNRWEMQGPLSVAFHNLRYNPNELGRISNSTRSGTTFLRRCGHLDRCVVSSQPHLWVT